jgi:signal transduction histidine kinase/CheY-like chemotaxis protein
MAAFNSPGDAPAGEAVTAKDRGDEVAALRRTLRDLVGLSALPAIWAGYPSDAIVESLAETLLKTLDLDVIYVRLPRGAAGVKEASWYRGLDSGARGAEAARTVGEAFAPWLRDPFNRTAAIPHPFGEGVLQIAITRFGYGSDVGVVMAGSSRPGFPSEEERLLLSVGANQAALAIQRKRDEEERLDLLEREREAHHEAQRLNEVARSLGAELDVHTLVQKVTDAGRELTGAQFGAFFYNAVNEQGESYVLYTLSGAPREAFERFGLPRNTPMFGPTFRGEGVVRIADVLVDPRYGKNPPHHGMPEGHLPVRSYLAVPVISRRGVLGGLFFGHPEPGVFSERSERLSVGLASQAAIAIDNAQLYEQAKLEIAERRSAEESERAARSQAEQASRLRDEFLATVSHELRTPLNSILGWAEILRATPLEAGLMARALEAIERGARAQTRLVEDLLDMSSIISGKLRLEVRTIELVPLIRAAIETMRPAAEAKQIRIEQVMDPFAGPIKGDPARLQQVFWNLFSNAVKFTPKGGKIQVHLERVNSHVEVSVSDTGRGIAPEFLFMVFDRFRQADSSTTRRFGGLGLGLAIVKHLIELHGGRVAATSPGEGMGSTFSIHLPIALARHDSLDREHPVAPVAAGQDVVGEMELVDVRVLVVDDDADACEMLKRLFQEEGATVGTMSSAGQALEHLRQAKYDVIVSDIGMPEMDGYEFIRTLRSRGDRTPAVAVTAFARSQDRIRALQAGYHMHVAKPLEPRELVAVVAALVGTGRKE